MSIKAELPEAEEDPITVEELVPCVLVRTQLDQLARWCEARAFADYVTGCFVRVLGPDRRTLVLDRVRSVQPARTVAGMHIERKLCLHLLGDQQLASISNRAAEPKDVAEWIEELMNNNMLPNREYVTQKRAQLAEQWKYVEEQIAEQRRRDEKVITLGSDSDDDQPSIIDPDAEQPLIRVNRRARTTSPSSISSSSIGGGFLGPRSSSTSSIFASTSARRRVPTAPSSPEGTPVQTRQDLLPAMVNSLDLCRMRKYLEFDEYLDLASSAYVRLVSGARKKIDLLIGVLACQPYEFYGQQFDKRFSTLWSNICRLGQITSTPTEETTEEEFNAWMEEMNRRRRTLPTIESVREKRAALDEALSRIEREHADDPDYPILHPPPQEDNDMMLMMPLMFGSDDEVVMDTDHGEEDNTDDVGGIRNRMGKGRGAEFNSNLQRRRGRLSSSSSSCSATSNNQDNGEDVKDEEGDDCVVLATSPEPDEDDNADQQSSPKADAHLEPDASPHATACAITADADDVRRITLNVQDLITLAQLGTPHMRELTHGCFVRMFNDKNGKNQLHQIFGLQTGQHYRVKTATIDKYLLLGAANGSQVSTQQVSSKPATDAEWDEFQAEWAKSTISGLPLPTKEFVRAKAEQLDKAREEASASQPATSCSSSTEKQPDQKPKIEVPPPQKVPNWSKKQMQAQLKRPWTATRQVPVSSSSAQMDLTTTKRQKPLITNYDTGLPLNAFGSFSSSSRVVPPPPRSRHATSSADDPFRRMGFPDDHGPYGQAGHSSIFHPKQEQREDADTADWIRRADRFVARVGGQRVEQIQVRLERSDSPGATNWHPSSRAAWTSDNSGRGPMTGYGTQPRALPPPPPPFRSNRNIVEQRDSSAGEESSSEDEAAGVRAARKRVIDGIVPDGCDGGGGTAPVRPYAPVVSAPTVPRFQQQQQNAKQFEQQWYGGGGSARPSSAPIRPVVTYFGNNDNNNRFSSSRPQFFGQHQQQGGGRWNNNGGGSMPGPSRPYKY